MRERTTGDRKRLRVHGSHRGGGGLVQIAADAGGKHGPIGQGPLGTVFHGRQQAVGVRGDLSDEQRSEVERGGDWIEYTVTSPTTGVVEPKMTYILPVDEQHVMGCGVYKPVIQRRQAVPRLGNSAAPKAAPARAAVPA